MISSLQCLFLEKSGFYITYQFFHDWHHRNMLGQKKKKNQLRWSWFAKQLVIKGGRERCVKREGKRKEMSCRRTCWVANWNDAIAVLCTLEQHLLKYMHSTTSAAKKALVSPVHRTYTHKYTCKHRCGNSQSKKHIKMIIVNKPTHSRLSAALTFWPVRTHKL